MPAIELESLPIPDDVLNQVKSVLNLSKRNSEKMQYWTLMHHLKYNVIIFELYNKTFKIL